MSNSLIRSIRIDSELFHQFDIKYGKEFISKFINQALKFALIDSQHFSVIFWQEYQKIKFEKEIKE